MGTGQLELGSLWGAAFLALLRLAPRVAPFLRVAFPAAFLRVGLFVPAFLGVFLEVFFEVGFFVVAFRRVVLAPAAVPPSPVPPPPFFFRGGNSKPWRPLSLRTSVAEKGRPKREVKLSRSCRCRRGAVWPSRSMK